MPLFYKGVQAVGGIVWPGQRTDERGGIKPYWGQ